MKRPRTLLIGLDGATFDIIDPLIQAGDLPNLSKLMAQGVRGPLKAWPNLNSASAWSSMVTGYNPAQHNIYNFGDGIPQRGSQWRPTTAADRQKDPFWRLLSAAGQRVGVMNMPITYPVDRINGFMLAGMDAPDVRSSGFAHPPDLLDELRQQAIDYIIDVPKLKSLSRRNPYESPPLVHQMIEARSRATLYLMQARPCDVLMTVFVATDRMQHFFWPDESASVDSPSWMPIRRVYQQIDSFIGQALKLMDEETTVLVVSDHGFGSVQLATRSLNRFFARLGLLRFHQRGGRWEARLLRSLLESGRTMIPLSFQRPLALAFPGLHRRAVDETKFYGIDWSQTQIFSVPPSSTEIFVNLKGREPEGIVPPDQYEQLREQIRDVMLCLMDPATGQPVIRAVYKGEAVYRGPYRSKAPDLLIEWDDEAAQDGLSYSDGEKSILMGPAELSGYKAGWKGSHRSHGILIAAGPHVRRGMTVADARIYDIAPTILYLQDHSIPNDMDGNVLTQIFTEDHLHRHPIRQSEPTRVEMPTTARLDETEAGKIEERLRDLGYIE